ncbi:MAG: hypothetical protein IIA64_11040 [Planctomycetes bacterium]|nr:hypothetical protein [Planctomycetota bacterium]
MTRSRRFMGFTIVDLLIFLVVVTVLISLALPTLARARGDSMVQESMANLSMLSVAHVMYAADWNGRQVTWVVDDLGVYDSVQDYCDAHGYCDYYGGPGCHPPLLAGWGCDVNDYCRVYAYRPCVLWSYNWAVNPIGFPGMQEAVDGFGHFRLANSKAFHDYVNGRFYDPTFYAPNDTVPYDLALPLFGDPNEFNTEGNPPIWVSYVLSPAAMYDPDVMRSNAAGGWQNPWDLDYGFQSPGLFQAQYPDLKTHMIEHNWVQNPPAECNPAPPPPFGYGVCEPYYFNHGIDSTPVTLFYDGHVRLLPNTEVYAADQLILKQTGGVDGLWHRGTPFGEDGYYISYGYDGAPLSHHILTTDGILGRDTLGGMPSMPVDWPRQWAPKKRRPPTAADRPDASHSFTLTLDEGG